MGSSDHKNYGDQNWWLDRWIWAVLGPVLSLIPEGKDKKRRRREAKPRIVRKELYGSSEPCYCGSEKKYKHCCKKINKKENKIAYKIIKTTRKGERVKIKVEKEAKIRPLFTNHPDSGIDPTHMG